MSGINQAFQLAAAYRQQAIDQNEQAAMQGPLLAVQALSAGLQAQAQSQQAQFQMQSMVLDTQLRIEESRAKQAMQLMEFDMAQKQLAANTRMAQQNYELNKMRTDAAVEADQMQTAVHAYNLKKLRDEQVGSVFEAGLQAQYGLDSDAILSGAASEQMRELATSNPGAHAALLQKHAVQRDVRAGQLTQQSILLEKEMNAQLSELRGLPAAAAREAQQRIRGYYLPMIQKNADKIASITGQPAMKISGPPSVADLFPTGGQRITPAEGKTLIEMMGEPPLEPLRGKDESDAAFKSRMDAYRSDPYFQQVDAIRKAAFASAGISMASSSKPAVAEPAAVAGIKEGVTVAALEKERELLAAAKAQSPQERQKQLAAQAVADTKAAQSKAKAAEIDDFRGSVATPLRTSIDTVFKNPARSTYDQAVATELDTLLAAVTKAFETGKPVRREWTPAEAARQGRVNPLARPFVRPPIASEVEELRQAKTLFDALSILRRLDRI